MFEWTSPVRPSADFVSGSSPACDEESPLLSFSSRVVRGASPRAYVPWTRREVMALMFLLALAAAYSIASDTWARTPAADAAADRVHLLEVIP